MTDDLAGSGRVRLDPICEVDGCDAEPTKYLMLGVFCVGAYCEDHADD